ncbi:hypothetical protein D918_00488 [Trichuris suis]|nr:hypothetical protein D918_00488 [Trichuris suis]
MRANALPQLPPLTPGTNQKLSEALRSSYSSFDAERAKLNIPKNPVFWSPHQVRQWLFWAIREFSLNGVVIEHYALDGRELCSLTREEFLNRSPPFVGDILWEHLDTMQKDSLKEPDAFCVNEPYFRFGGGTCYLNDGGGGYECDGKGSPAASSYDDPQSVSDSSSDLHIATAYINEPIIHVSPNQGAYGQADSGAGPMQQRKLKPYCKKGQAGWLATSRLQTAIHQRLANFCLFGFCHLQTASLQANNDRTNTKREKSR